MSQLFDSIIRGSIRRRHLVMLGALAVVVVVGWFARSARVDALPSFTPPMVTVQAEARGMGSQEVEERITAPLEQALLGTPELVRERSTSSPGLAVVELTFEEDTDIARARQLVSERLTVLRDRLPQGLPAPALAPISAPVGALLRVCFTPGSDNAEAMRELTRFGEWHLRPRLQAIQGVSRVTLHGGAALRIEVRPDLAAMIGRNVTLSDLEQSLREGQSLVSAGYTAVGDAQHAIRIDSFWTIGSVESIGATVVASRAGQPVRIADVATIAMGEAPAVGAALYDGRPAIYVQIDKLPWADTLRVTSDVEQALRELDAVLPPGAARHPPIFRQADFVKKSISAIGRAMAIGALLVAIVLVCFLRSGRLVAISLAALPLSMLAALAVLLARGATLNGMILGGLAIAVGEVVDDAIVDVENIWRRLRENAALPSPRPALEVIHDASAEIRGAVVYATSIVIVVLTPVLFLGGVAGRIFSPLAEAYAVAMAASLLVALTVTPALCALLLPRLDLAHVAEPPLTRRARRAYERVLALARRHPGTIVVTSAALAVLAVATIPFLSGGFLPQFREGVLIADITAWPGTSLEETTRLTKQIDAQLRGTGRLPHVAARIGRASLDEDAAPVHRIEMDLVLPLDDDDPEAIAEELARRIGLVPGVRFNIEGFLGERINELLSGERAPIAVKLYGTELDELRARARELVPKVAALEGVQSVRADALVDVPTTDLRIDDAGLGVLGLRRSDVATATAAFRQGLDVAEARAPGGFSVPVTIAGDLSLRQPERLLDLPLFTPAGGVLPLSSAVQVITASEPAAIRHDDGRRVLTVTARASAGDLSAVADRIERLLRQPVHAAPGSSWQLAGQAAERDTASAQLVITVIVVLLAVFAFLWLAFGSIVDSATVLAGLPLGLVGGVVAALVLPEGLSMAGFVGFVTLIGIISRNGIMLVAHKNHLLASGSDEREEDLVVEAARERLVPILMTAGSAFFGLLPLAISITATGSELESPMAFIVCGGLFTSTALNLVAVPAFFLWRSRRRRTEANT